MKGEHPHLGEMVNAQLKRTGMKKAELGRRVGHSRQYVDLILKKQTFDTGLLMKICQVLEYDFFAEIAAASGASWRKSTRLSFDFPDQGLVLLNLDPDNQTKIDKDTLLKSGMWIRGLEFKIST